MIALHPYPMRRRTAYECVLVYTFMIYPNTPPFLVKRLEPILCYRFIIGYHIPLPYRTVLVLKNLPRNNPYFAIILRKEYV
jgi:hypothetical protein